VGDGVPRFKPEPKGSFGSTIEFQNRPNEENRPNDRFQICKRTLAKDTMNDR
jgi:hypothetical protein